MTPNIQNILAKSFADELIENGATHAEAKGILADALSDFESMAEEAHTADHEAIAVREQQHNAAIIAAGRGHLVWV